MISFGAYLKEKVQPKNTRKGFLGTIKNKKQLDVAVDILKKAGMNDAGIMSNYLDSTSGRHLADMMDNGDAERSIVMATKKNLKMWMKKYDPEYFEEAQENPEVKAGAVEYVRMANAAFDGDKESKYFKERDTSVVMKTAQKYYKIWVMEFGRLSSIHAFIDIETGDLLKPAGTKKPAKGARGNVTDDAFMKKLKGGKFDKYGGHLYLRR